MSWKCAACDTYNEDHERICFVCGQERSIAIIKGAEKKLGEKRKGYIFDAISKCALLLEKKVEIIYMLSLLIGFAAIIIILISSIVGGQMGDLWLHVMLIPRVVKEHLLNQYHILKIMGQLYKRICTSLGLLYWISCELFRAIGNAGFHLQFFLVSLCKHIIGHFQQ